MSGREGLVTGPLLPGDLPAAVALERGTAPRPWSQRALADSLLAGHLCRKAVLDGRLAGYGVLRLAGEESELLNLMVGAGFRGRGIGRELLDALLAEAAAAGAAVCHLEVRVSNGRARRLYAGRGFVRSGLRRGYYRKGTGREDALLMRCYL